MEQSTTSKHQDVITEEEDRAETYADICRNICRHMQKHMQTYAETYAWLTSYKPKTIVHSLSVTQTWIIARMPKQLVRDESQATHTWGTARNDVLKRGIPGMRRGTKAAIPMAAKHPASNLLLQTCPMHLMPFLRSRRDVKHHRSWGTYSSTIILPLHTPSAGTWTTSLAASFGTSYSEHKTLWSCQT